MLFESIYCSAHITGPQTLSSLVCRIAEALESPETAAHVKESFDSFRKNAQTMDLGMIMQTIIKNGLGMCCFRSPKPSSTNTLVA